MKVLNDLLFHVPFIALICISPALAKPGHAQVTPPRQAVAQQTCSAIKAQTNRVNSLRVTTGSVLRPTGAEGFDIYRTIRNILQTSTKPIASPTRADIENFINSLPATLPATTNTSSKIGGNIAWPVPVTRSGRSEALLKADILLPSTSSKTATVNTANKTTGFQPIALFNRFDLAPADFSNCGEYRIVYGLYPNAIFSRLLVIFEGRVKNPNIGMDLAGRRATCGLIAKFWEDLSIAGPASAAFRQDLENFYYNGITLKAAAPNTSASLPAGTLVSFPPVVRFAGYGNPIGQVRLNLFRGGDWMLTETVVHVVNGANKFVAQQTANTPMVELYADTGPAALAELQAQFRGMLRTRYLGALTQPEFAGPDTLASTPSCPPLNFSLPTNQDFNDFESLSQNSSDDVNSVTPNTNGNAGVGKIRQIAGKFIQARQNLAAPSDNVERRFNNLSVSHVLNRAGTATCAGCHQLSVGTPVFKKDNGNEITWPSSLGFVHVGDLGASGKPPVTTQLSPALNACFLPKRDSIVTAGACR